jgi:hypothetical protein
MRLTSRATQPEGRTSHPGRVVLRGRGLSPQRRPAAAEVSQKARTLIAASVECRAEARRRRGRGAHPDGEPI